MIFFQNYQFRSNEHAHYILVFITIIGRSHATDSFNHSVFPGYGGPHAAFFAIRDIGNLKRSLPGRLIGVTRYLPFSVGMDLFGGGGAVGCASPSLDKEDICIKTVQQQTS